MASSYGKICIREGGEGMGTKTSRQKEGQLWTLLNRTHHAMWRAREKELAGMDISMIQSGVLFVVSNIDEPVTPAMLSRYLYREPHTISGLLSRMEKQGLVKRVRDLKRKNQVRVELTQKGKKAYEQQSKAGVVNKIVTNLSPEERANLSVYLEKLRTSALTELRAQSPLPYTY
jgi:MarR family transcriptional regulator, organic hydroperoxide resistance regulator